MEDGIHFEYQGMQPIREDDEYNNFCVSICAMYGKMKIPMKIDITTGDKITQDKLIMVINLCLRIRVCW